MKNFKILMVDDEPGTVHKFEQCFKEYNIKTFSKPEEALKVIEEEQFDLFFLDIYMPQIDGISLCRKIRESSLNRHAYVIAYTCEDDEKRQLAIFKEDFDDFIVKLTNFEMIKTKVNALYKKELRKINNKSNQLVEINHNYYLNGQKIKFTPTEFQIIGLLDSGQLDYYSSANIEEMMNDKNMDNNLSTFRVHIKNIRNKFYEIEPEIEYIKTISRKGYKLINLEVFSFNSNKISNLSNLRIPEIEDRNIVNVIQKKNLTPIQKLRSFANKDVNDNISKINLKKREIERQIYSLSLNKDLFNKCEQIAQQKGSNISFVIEDFLNSYYLLEIIDPI